MRRTATMMFLTASAASGAAAEDVQNLCSERPGITTNQCVIDPGELQIETGLADWTDDRRGANRRDTLLLGDTLLRLGIGGDNEIRFGWTPLGREQDRAGDATRTYDRIGDITLGFKHTVIDAARHGNVGLSFALLPFASIPNGRAPIGAGTWSAGMQLPVGYRINEKLKLAFTPIVAAAFNKSGNGRHLEMSAAGGVKYNVTEAISLQLESR